MSVNALLRQPLKYKIYLIPFKISSSFIGSVFADCKRVCHCIPYLYPHYFSSSNFTKAMSFCSTELTLRTNGNQMQAADHWFDLRRKNHCQENRFRTKKSDEAAELICQLDKAFSENKNGQTSIKTSLSTCVIRIGFEPMTLSLEG